jgi:hypothetical protein
MSGQSQSSIRYLQQFQLLLISEYVARSPHFQNQICDAHPTRHNNSPFNALMTKEEADGTTATVACRFWMVSWTVTRRPFQSPVAFAISSPIFFGD